MKVYGTRDIDNRDSEQVYYYYYYMEARIESPQAAHPGTGD